MEEKTRLWVYPPDVSKQT